MIEMQNDRLAICVVGYNRLYSIKRLLQSLLWARYDMENVPLVISIDCSGATDLYAYVNEFEWPFGKKYVIIREERLGLKEHILRCGDLSQQFKGVIILEDDIFVSPEFYQFADKASSFYEQEKRVGGISLFQDEMGSGSVPHIFYNDGSDAYLKQEPSSWGELWTKDQWSDFGKWLASFQEEQFADIDMPTAHKLRKKAWSKYFEAYLIETHKYVVYPYVSHTTCFGEAGEHNSSSSTIGQVNLLSGSRNYQFRPFDEMTKYDIYDTNLDVYKWAGYDEANLSVDWYGMNPNLKRKRYILTTIKLPLKPIKTFGLLMRPIELNVKYGIEGEEIYVYDTVDGSSNTEGKDFPLSVGYYYQRMFRLKLAKKYVIDRYKQLLKRKILNRFC